MRTLRTRGIGIVVVLASGALALSAPGALAAPRQFRLPAGARPQLDARAGERAHVPGATHAARVALQRQLGIEGVVSGDPVGGGLRSLVRTDGFLSGPRAGGAATVALGFVRAHETAFGMSAGDLAALRLVSRTRSNHGVTHLTWVPYVDGIPAYDSELRVHVAADGRVIAASGPPLGGLSIASATPRLSASQALAVGQRDVGAPTSFPAARTSPGAERTTSFSNGDRASLVVLAAPSGDRLAWRLTVSGRNPYVYDEAVDASTGQVLVRHSLTDFASSAHVFFYHPGAAAGGTATQVDLAPYLTSSTTLSGPNAHAYADPNDDGQGTDGTPVEIPPSSGTDWDYPQTPVSPAGGQFCSPFGGGSGICTWDGATTNSELTNRNQVTTQIFWYVNNFHDWLKLAPIGFDDASGNFEVGGTGGSDPVNAESDDAILAGQNAQLNNANMSTPGDGHSPTMQMYLFNSPFPAVNGGDDASIVYHEYTHGLSNRLIDPANANGLNANQSGAMGEAWSDWYAMDYLVDQGFVNDTATDGQVVVGEYATGDSVHGIRNQALDCAVNSPASACGGSVNAGHAGGFTYADLGKVTGYNSTTPAFEVHADGEIWGETLWDLRTALGGPTARMLVTDALRLSPLDPSFLDERDAILAADQIDDGGAHHDQIWQVFAVRGMGFGAQTTSSNATRGVADFTTPQLAASAGTFADDGAPFGDGDGTPEPGEALRLDVGVQDPGLADLTHVHGTLTSSDPNVFIGRADADYGTIAGGNAGSGQTPFTVTLTSGLTCGAQVPFNLHVTSDQGAIDLPLAIDLGSGRNVFTSSDGAHSIPDGDPFTGTSSTLTVPTGGRIDALRVTLNVGPATAQPVFTGDLTATLTSPSGKQIDLLERPGFGQFGSDDDWNGPVTFRDDAGDSIQEIGDGGTLTGSLVPDEPLSAFAGQDRSGVWTLRMTDAATPNGATLNGWSLDTDQPSCNAASALPNPTTTDATSIGSSSATLTGTLASGGEPSQARFELGTTASYGQTTPSTALGSLTSSPVTSAISGLAPSTTYHYRLDALRGGELIAVGADRTFTTTAIASAGATGGGGLVAKTATHVTRLLKRATLDRHNRFVFTFQATPAGLHGTIKFVLPKRGHRRALTLATARFTTTASGRVRVVVTLKGTALRRLRALHGAKLSVTISLGGKRFVVPLKLSVPRPRHRRH